MRHLLRLAVVIVLLAAPAIALSAEVQGKVKTIDAGDRVVTLEDGTQITIPEGIAIDMLKEGADITVSYEERDGKNQATNVEMK
jgi:ferric-dicitrate binding protein FerR (iron transport regulator)